MDPSLRVVTRLPLQELWDNSGTLPYHRTRNLSYDDILMLLRGGELRFVTANVGDPLQWHLPGNCYHLWKTELQSRLRDAGQHVSLDTFPGGYCYIASEWNAEDDRQLVVVLEVQH